MTKWQRLVSRVKISKILLCIIFFAFFKLGYFAFLGNSNVNSFVSQFIPVKHSIAADKFSIPSKDYENGLLPTGKTYNDISLPASISASSQAENYGQDQSTQSQNTQNYNQNQNTQNYNQNQNTQNYGQNQRANQAQDFSKQDRIVLAEAQTVPKSPPLSQDPKNWDALKKREDELVTRERSMKELETALNAKLEQLQKLEQDVQALLDKAETVKDKKLRHLVDTYANMKPAQAAKVLESLEENLAVRILSAMRGRQAGEIFTFMDPMRAAKLSEKLTLMYVPFDDEEK